MFWGSTNFLCRKKVKIINFCLNRWGRHTVNPCGFSMFFPRFQCYENCPWDQNEVIWKGKLCNVLKLYVGLKGRSYPLIISPLKFASVHSQTDFFELEAPLDMCSLPSETAPELLCDVYISVHIQFPKEEKHPSNKQCWVLRKHSFKGV